MGCGRAWRAPVRARSIAGRIEHAQAYYGAQDLDEVARRIDSMSLAGIAQRITCPLLVAHGVRDRQVPLEQAEQTVRAAVNSPCAELRMVTAEEGGVEHCSGDLMTMALDAMADWVADVFGTAR